MPTASRCPSRKTSPSAARRDAASTTRTALPNPPGCNQTVSARTTVASAPSSA